MEYCSNPRCESWGCENPKHKRKIIMSEFKKYVRKGYSEMRPYVPDEDLSNVSVADVDTPELGGMIARNPKNHKDQWYVAKQYFKDNLELVTRFLKSCLYCGEEYQINLKADDESFCFACDWCSTHGPKATTPKEAEELWNEVN